MHTLNDDKPNNTIAWNLAWGSSSYLFEVLLKEALKIHVENENSGDRKNHLNENVENESPVNAEDDFPIETKGARHKLVLLHELGVLKFLNDKYGSKMKDTDFAHLLCLITGTDSDSFRKEWKPVLFGTLTSKGENPINPRSMKAVQMALIRLGINNNDHLVNNYN